MKTENESGTWAGHCRLAPGLTVVCLVGGLVLASFGIQAQELALDWSTMAGGGVTSSGGVYCLSGTMGQLDAGTLAGGPFKLDGGFWSVVTAVQTPGASWLSVTRVNGAVRVSWPASAVSFALEQTPTLVGSPVPWTPVPFPAVTNAAEVSITVPAPTGTRFYRLRRR